MNICRGGKYIGPSGLGQLLFDDSQGSRKQEHLSAKKGGSCARQGPPDPQHRLQWCAKGNNPLLGGGVPSGEARDTISRETRDLPGVACRDKRHSTGRLRGSLNSPMLALLYARTLCILHQSPYQLRLYPYSISEPIPGQNFPGDNIPIRSRNALYTRREYH